MNFLDDDGSNMIATGWMNGATEVNIFQNEEKTRENILSYILMHRIFMTIQGRRQYSSNIIIIKRNYIVEKKKQNRRITFLFIKLERI